MELQFPRLTSQLLDEYRADGGAVSFIEQQCVCRSAFDGGRSWIRPILTDLQKQVVNDVLTTRDSSGDLLYTTMLLSWGRKMAKTWLASAMWTYRAVCWPNELILLSGPTRDCARELAFTSIIDTFIRNEALKRAVGAELLKGTIKIKATGSEIRAVSRTLGAQAGADWSVCMADELWSWQGKQMTEFFRTLTTPSPSRISPLVCVTSYAPIKGRSVLLEQLLARAKRKEPHFYSSIVSGAPAIVAACPWISMKFLREMKRSQPAKVFKRVFLNRAVADMDEQDRYAFSRGQIAAVVDAGWKRQESLPPDARGVVVCGVDFAAKHDCAAVAALVRMKDRTIALLDMVVGTGSKSSPLPGGWVTETIQALIGKYGPLRVMADPTNITDPLVALRSQGISVTEINRKGPQLALKLYSAIAGRKIRIYPDAGVVETNDGRRYGLTDELHNLQLDTETGKLGHIGEGISAGRHYDNRCTSIGLALSADELSLENTAALPATVADFFRSQPQAFDRANGTSSRRFRGATFAPVIASPSPSGRDPFGFTLGRRHF